MSNFHQDTDRLSKSGNAKLTKLISGMPLVRQIGGVQLKQTIKQKAAFTLVFSSVIFLMLMAPSTSATDPLTAPTITTSSSYIHPGDIAHLTMVNPPTGGVAPYSYYWGCSTWDNSIYTTGVIKIIPGATSESYDFKTDSSTVLTTYVFKLLVVDSVGNKAWQMYPITVMVADEGVYPLSKPVIGLSSSVVDQGQKVELSFTAPMTGGVGPYSYVWVIVKGPLVQQDKPVPFIPTDEPSYSFFTGDLAPGDFSIFGVAVDSLGNFAYSQPTRLTVQPAIQATVDIKPEAYNLKKQSGEMTAYIQLPQGYSVNDIDASTVKLVAPLNGLPEQTACATAVGDFNKDGISDLMVKFKLPTTLSPLPDKFTDVTLTVSGCLKDGTFFTGADTIKVISN